MGTADDDIFTGGSDADTAQGGGGNDSLSGNGGGDILAGGAGEDVVSGGDGDDRLYSGDETPAFNQPYYNNPYTPPVLDTGAEVDTLVGGDGSDRIFAGYGDSVDGGANGSFGDYLYISFMGASTGVTADFRLTTQVIGGGTITGIESISWVQGSNYADTITLGSNGSGYSDFGAVFGMGGDDHLTADYYTGVLSGDDGDDIVDGRNSQYLQAVYGGAGDDTLYTNSNTFSKADGGDGNDTIYSHGETHGGAGDDVILMQWTYYSGWVYGDAGDDQITAAGSGNAMSGGAGADILTGSALGDTLYSGDGNQTGAAIPIADMGLEKDQLFGLDGNDVLAAGYGDEVDGGNGTDTLRLSLGGLASGIAFSTAGIVSGQPVVLGGGTIQNVEKLVALRGTEFADTLTLVTQTDLLTVDGGAGDDVVISSNSSVNVFGGAGDDRFVSGKAGDTFDGGAGSDTIDYSGYATALTIILANGVGPNGDTFTNVENIIGGSGDDTLIGDGGNNALTGGAGIDTVSYATASSGVTVDIALAGAQQTGGGGADTLSGFENLTGSSFGDRLSGDAGANLLTGGGGNDVLIGRGGADTLSGGSGTDAADYSGAAAGVHADLSAQLVSNDGDGASDTLSSIESIVGSAFGDTIVGDAGTNVLTGGAGADILTGGAGADTFKYVATSDSAPAAYDTITDFQTSVDRIDLTAFQPAVVGIQYAQGMTYVTTPGGGMKIAVAGEVGITDIMTGTATSFTILGDDGGRTLTGGVNADTLVGGALGDTLNGGAGNDTLNGGGGADALWGGAGANIFAYASALDSDNAHLDIIHDFKAGVDKVDLSAIAPSNVSILHHNGGTFVNGGGIGGAFQIASINSIDGVDILGLTNGVYMVGDDSADTLIGSAKDDTIVGEAGNDTIIGGDVGDALFGGAGADTFAYRSATESNSAAGQLDIIHDFQSGVDTLDLTALNPSNVSILHYNGGTFVNGGGIGGAFQIASINRIDGVDILGLTNGVYMVGDDGADTLIGSAKSDTVVGGAGDDMIIGGEAGDALFGGTGADTFAYRSVEESNARQLDIIHDFQTGVDKLDLTALDPTNVSILRYQGGALVFGVSHSTTFQIAATTEINASDILGLTSGAYMLGDGGADTLVGGSFSETIVGKDGDDTIIGGGGADALFGWAGADTFKFVAKTDSTLDAPDIIHDFQTGVDKVDLTALHTNGANDHYSLVSDANASYLFVQLNGNTGNDMLILFATPDVHASDILW
ncbi:calcium-binding protein [Caulobacter sp. BK020]|uniref:beta strand repeat-containing protein n=1 Tax=Caulobacter sp. BK020 TaxID=2512117 RepID=UPI0014051628|nr:calcium-binding protein [Caulobacter sp. BK020]